MCVYQRFHVLFINFFSSLHSFLRGHSIRKYFKHRWFSLWNKQCDDDGTWNFQASERLFFKSPHINLHGKLSTQKLLKKKIRWSFLITELELQMRPFFRTKLAAFEMYTSILVLCGYITATHDTFSLRLGKNSFWCRIRYLVQRFLTNI